VELLSRELGVPIFKLEQWRQKADAALDGALRRAQRLGVRSGLTASRRRPSMITRSAVLAVTG